jgi:hypothetical protein
VRPATTSTVSGGASGHDRRAALRTGLAAAVAIVALAGCGSDSSGPRAAAAPAPSPTETATPSPAAPSARSVAVVWSLERPQRAARRLRRHPAVEAATVAGRGVGLLRSSADASGRVVERARPGYAVPLDALAVEPRSYAGTLPTTARDALDGLRPGRAVLSRTSARLRGIGEGGELRLVGGRRLRVAAVVDDALVHDAELAVAAGEPRVRRGDSGRVIAVLRPEFAVNPTRLARQAERGAAARIVEGGPLAATGPAGPARPAELKARFGEPAVRLPYGDDWVQLDPGFVNRYIVARGVPVLGAVTCHRAMIPPLREALSELRSRGLARLVDPRDYAGCYAPRRIRPRGDLSLHAWGLAIDLNASANPYGGRSHQDPRLVRIMRRHGFTWGGDWPTIRDPMHFELRGR